MYGEVELNPGPVTFMKTNNVLLKGISVKHFRGKTTPILDCNTWVLVVLETVFFLEQSHVSYMGIHQSVYYSCCWDVVLERQPRKIY